MNKRNNISRIKARSIQDIPPRDWPALKDHLLETGDKAEGLMAVPDLKNFSYIAGLFHDLGKYRDEFQEYLHGKREKSKDTYHSQYGSDWLMYRILTNHKLRSMLLSILAIDAHHTRLKSMNEYKKLDRREFMFNDMEKSHDHFTSILKDDTPELIEIYQEIESKIEQSYSSFTPGFIDYKMVFSSLVDADRLHSEEVSEPVRSKFRPANNNRYSDLDPEQMIPKLKKKVDRLYLKSKDPISDLRNEVRLQVLQSAANGPGCYSLSLPTGAGKTLISLEWALHHAKEMGYRRIIIVIPYISIIDQTSDVIKKIFTPNEVLEHHCSFLPDRAAGEDPNILYAYDNWDFPIIVTTSVQFFETMFSSNASQNRKFHNIENSCIIFDEIHTIPANILSPTIHMMKMLIERLNISMLLCSATMPPFDNMSEFCGTGLKATPVYDIKNYRKIAAKLRRVKVKMLNNLRQVSIEKIINDICGSSSTSDLVILNTILQARSFLDVVLTSDKIKEKYGKGIFYLSSNLCPFDRKKIIDKIKHRLARRLTLKTLVVATPVMEIGVDFDFDKVYREICPVNSMIQSAGRSNRSGRMGLQGGTLTMFRITPNMAQKYFPDKVYRNMSVKSLENIDKIIKGFYNHDVIKDHFISLIRDEKTDIETESYYGNMRYIKDMLCDPPSSIDFPAISEGYKYIPDAKIEVFISHRNERSEYLRNKIIETAENRRMRKEDSVEMHSYCVTLYRSTIDKYSEIAGSELVRKIPGTSVHEWIGDYSPEYGITPRSRGM